MNRSASRQMWVTLLACAGTLLLVSACVAQATPSAPQGTARPGPIRSAADAVPGHKPFGSTGGGPAGFTGSGTTHCGGAGEQPLGHLGMVRPGQTTAARNALGPALLAEVSDIRLGAVDIALTANNMTTAQRHRDFSSWEPVLSQSSQPRLRSCHMQLSDQPADQPIISAALAAVASHGYTTSAAHLRSTLLEVLVSDNPAANGSVIVTLQTSGGPAYEMPAKGGPPVHGYLAYTVLENLSHSQVTGVAPGGFGAEAALMVKCRLGPAPPASAAGPAAASIEAIKQCR